MSSNDRTSDNWEGVVLSGWQRSENLIACHGIQRQIQMGIWHKPKLANLLAISVSQNLLVFLYKPTLFWKLIPSWSINLLQALTLSLASLHSAWCVASMRCCAFLWRWKPTGAHWNTHYWHSSGPHNNHHHRHHHCHSYHQHCHSYHHQWQNHTLINITHNQHNGCLSEHLPYDILVILRVLVYLPRTPQCCHHCLNSAPTTSIGTRLSC